jgi:hypothetical protein
VVVDHQDPDPPHDSPPRSVRWILGDRRDLAQTEKSTK